MNNYISTACLLFLFYSTGTISIKITSINVPKAVVGEDVTLTCNYDLEGSSLYGLKWYKGMNEFIRFIPKEERKWTIFPVERGVPLTNFSTPQSDTGETIILKSVKKEHAGRYTCEISADAPSFSSDMKSKTLVIQDNQLVTPRQRKTEDPGVLSRHNLLGALFLNYDRWIYPQSFNLKIGISIINADIDKENYLLKTHALLKYTWKDTRLIWDSQQRKIQKLQIPSSKIFLPDITLHNGARPKMDCSQSDFVSVKYTGEIVWTQRCHLVSYCNHTLYQTPTQVQQCKLIFKSWSFDDESMILEFQKSSADLDEYLGRKYSITKNVGIQNEKANGSEHIYTDLTFHLGLMPQNSCQV